MYIAESGISNDRKDMPLTQEPGLVFMQPPALHLLVPDQWLYQQVA